jgi:TolA-binding protein
MNIKLLNLILCLSYTLLSANEVSVFGAGNLESLSPYGLTDSEKLIIKNKNNLTKFDYKIDSTRSKIEILSERLDGFESIFDGNGRRLKSVSNTLSQYTLQLKSNQLLFEQFEELQKQNQKDINNLKIESKDLRDTLIDLVKQIEKDYVTKQQFEKLRIFINNEFATLSKSKRSITSKQVKTKIFTKPKDKLLSDAKALFKKDYFTKAIPIFEYLITKKYKPAECNFYLGEMWFYRKKYKDAIHYFKTSMTLYDQAKYIPKLLLHSAISFENIKDFENASNFYTTLIDVYPDTKEVQKAKTNLANLN